MTRDEFYEKYGQVKVKFTSYYKYEFTYSTTLPDGRRLNCVYGGYADCIYRHVCNTEEITIFDLGPFKGVVLENGVEIEDFYDFKY